MKRITLALASLVALSGPLAATAAYADPPGRHHDRYDRRDDRRADRWDDRRYNGYTMNGRWYYGPPAAAHRGHADYGYRAWRRGDRLPDYYRTHYRVVDYRSAHLRAPPRGYHYVRDDRRGETLLVGIATGVILGVILSQ